MDERMYVSFMRNIFIVAREKTVYVYVYLYELHLRNCMSRKNRKSVNELIRVTPSRHNLSNDIVCCVLLSSTYFYFFDDLKNGYQFSVI